MKIISKLDLTKLNTKQLLGILYTYRNSLGKDGLPSKEDLKEELAKREHIPNSTQSKLIAKMSKKAGKRLTLKEAQLMKNKENK